VEFSVFIPLMVAAVQSSGQVLSSFVSKAKQAASNYIFDKEFVENTIASSTRQLDELLNATSADLKDEIREQSVRDVVEDLQAHITSIGKLLSLARTSEITPEMAERLITGGLLPFQVSLEKAELRLNRFGKDDLRLYCHVVGTNTLIAGYVFAGQKVPALQKDLKDSIYVFQKGLLDAIAKTNREIPWDKVPHLLTADGISDLFELYSLTLQDVKENSSNVEQETIKGNALKLRSFFTDTLYCSECGRKGIDKKAAICPSCKRKFARDIWTTF